MKNERREFLPVPYQKATPPAVLSRNSELVKRGSSESQRRDIPILVCVVLPAAKAGRDQSEAYSASQRLPRLGKLIDIQM